MVPEPAPSSLAFRPRVGYPRLVSYLVLARKYRPQSFEDLAGQEHVARTLANAIATNRVAHAFLFTGVRGVGKTTSARLLAKCLNCVGADGKATGPTAIPCQVCAPCKEITAGNDIDVQEIDGASYNGVDEVRKLQEGVAFRPARDRFKIYIVDEVHMLSNQAWNAFLKTLEEPPPHVKFIFATTEVHKVPVTILSRCQRYDFKLISTQTIAKRLREVLANEAIVADDAAVAVLAREAAGSMRDAMSLLDQVIAFSGASLTGDDVARVLGVADRKVLHDLAAALVDGDPAACLGVVDRVSQQGFDLAHVAKDVLRHLRDLVVAKVCGGAPGDAQARELLDLADEEAKDVFALAARADADDLLRLYQGFSRAFDDVVRSGQPRAALEMTLVRLARRPPLLPLDELLSRLGDLERRLGGGGGPSAPSPRGAGGGGAGGGGGRPTRASASISSAVSATAWTSDESPETSALRPHPHDDTQRMHGALALAREEPAPAPPKPRAVSPVAAAPPASAPPAAPTLPTPLAPPGAPPPRPKPEVAAPASDSVDAWRAILERVTATNRPLAAILANALPLEVSAARVVLGYPPSQAFYADQAKDPEALEALTREVRAYFDAPTEVALDLSAHAPSGVATIASIDSAKRVAAVAAAKSAVEKHPLVAEAMRIFGAEIRDIKLPGDAD